MTKHVMVDLETFSSKPNAAIVSIGAVKFDPAFLADQDVERFHVAVHPASCQRYRLHIDADTMLWWLHPDRSAARDDLLSHATHDLATALEAFAEWYLDGHIEGDPLPPVWGNGATFDNVILRHAYEVTGIECPWPFYLDRCHRTVKALAPDIKIEFAGGAIAHNALADAEAQTRQLLEVRDKLGLKL